VAKILIVTPDSETREQLACEFALDDNQVFACSRFEEAREAIDRVQPDVLVTNLRLQEYNGLSLVMRANERCPAAKKIVYTGHHDPVLRREAVLHGASYVLYPDVAGAELQLQAAV